MIPAYKANIKSSADRPLSFDGINVSKKFFLLFVSNVRQCFFNLGLKRRVWSALSTTLGRWIGFLCSRNRLLVDPFFWVCFFGALWLAQSGPAFCSPPSVTRGTRNTQLEWRPCWADVEATVAEESRDFYWWPCACSWWEAKANI